MIPPGNLPDWQRRIITLYFTDARDSFSHMMGFLWFNPDTITGKLSVQPIRYIRHIDVTSVFADRSELDTYHPRTSRKRFSQRPNTLEYWEKYGSLVVASGLVPLSSISPASPPASPWSKPFEKHPRGAFWDEIDSDSVVAEIGVDKAGTAIDVIIPKADPKKLYLIDPWDLIEDKNNLWANSEQNREFVQDKFKKNPNVEVIQDFSNTAAEKFDDQYFDVVFSDWAISYTDTKKDISSWLRKIKPGGYLAGDLFCIEDHHWTGAFGAVLEFLSKYVIKDKSIIERAELTREILVPELYRKYMDGKDIKNVEFYMKEQLFGDILVRHESNCLQIAGFSTIPEKCEDIIQTKPDLLTLKTLSDNKYFKYYPSSRVRAGTWRIEIGDWINDIDFDELSDWAEEETDLAWIPIRFEDLD